MTAVAILVPRVRRAVEGVGAAEVLDEAAVKALIADATAEIIFYTEGFWGHALVVTDDDNDIPTDWAIDPGVTEAEATVIVVQAALDYFFHAFKSAKTSESISRDGASWSWTESANLLNQRFELLREDRDKALAIIGRAHPVAARFASFIEVRDAATARVLEPYVNGMAGGEFQRGGGGGLELVR